MKLHRWAQLIKMCVMDKNENLALLDFHLSAHWFRWPWADTQKLKKQQVFSLAYDTHFDKLSPQCEVSLRYLVRFKSYGNFRWFCLSPVVPGLWTALIFKCLFFDRKLQMALRPSDNSFACHAGDQSSVPQSRRFFFFFVIKNCN